MKKQHMLIGLTIVTIILTGMFSFFQVKPRSASETQKQGPEFTNTMQILETLTQETHPSGSEANYKVRDYLLSEIDKLGLKAEVMPFDVSLTERIDKLQTRMAADEKYHAYMMNFMKAKGYDNVVDYVRGKFGNVQTDTVTLHNILVKLERSSADEGIMLVSHYDSVPTGPGAGDDGIAVASMLNFMQQAVKQDDLTNDIYFLFTDGEEQGLLGAYDYVENNVEHQKAKIQAVFNFEARGNRGGLFMFESSKDNYDLVKHFNKAVEQPIAFSIATEIYNRMPNDTDFSVFKRAKYDGLNFAMVEGFENYHADTDTAENLDKDTAYQYMQTVSGIGQYFGKLNLKTLKNDQRAVFFPFFGLTTIVLPEMSGYLFAFIPLILALIIFVDSVSRRGRASVGDYVRIIVALGVTYLAQEALPASYMLSIPLTFFFTMEAIANLAENREKGVMLGTIFFFLGVISMTLLALPLMYMIQVALQNVMITAVCVGLPTLLIVIYLRQLVRLSKAAEVEESLA